MWLPQRNDEEEEGKEAKHSSEIRRSLNGILVASAASNWQWKKLQHPVAKCDSGIEQQTIETLVPVVVVVVCAVHLTLF